MQSISVRHQPGEVPVLGHVQGHALHDLLGQCRAFPYLGQFQAALGRGDQLHADHLLIYRGDGGSRPMATHLGEPPHSLLPDAGKVLQSQPMWSQRLHNLHHTTNSKSKLLHICTIHAGACTTSSRSVQCSPHKLLCFHHLCCT